MPTEWKLIVTTQRDDTHAAPSLPLQSTLNLNSAVNPLEVGWRS